MRSCLLLLLAVEATARGRKAPTSIRLTGWVVPTRRGRREPRLDGYGVLVKPSPHALHAMRSQPRHAYTPRVLETASRRGKGIVQAATDLTITALRVGTCALCVHHGIDKLDNADAFTASIVAKSFGFMPGAPKLWTYAAALAQILGPLFLGFGLFSRPAALSMSGTMVAAVAFHLRNTGLEGFPLGVPPAAKYNFELGGMYLLVLLYFTAAGAGPFSVDEKVLGGELTFYRAALERISGRRAAAE